LCRKRPQRKSRRIPKRVRLR